jgi:hypothetical protein
VIRLPDQPQVDFQQFAGYITVDEVNQRNLFYYFVESEVDPVSKPVVLWLSGGIVNFLINSFVYYFTVFETKVSFNLHP